MGGSVLELARDMGRGVTLFRSAALSACFSRVTLKCLVVMVALPSYPGAGTRVTDRNGFLKVSEGEKEVKKKGGGRVRGFYRVSAGWVDERTNQSLSDGPITRRGQWQLRRWQI
jgi:hypothetical protein